MGNNMILPKTFILGNGETSMKIEKMTIDNVNGIKHLDLTFNNGLNLICGENGVGKTTILKSICYPFSSFDKNSIKTRLGTEEGSIAIKTSEILDHEIFKIKDFKMSDTGRNGKYSKFETTNDLIFFSSHHDIEYKKIKALLSCGQENELQSLNRPCDLLATGIKDDIKEWFINRFLFSKIEGSLNEYQLSNLKLCEQVISSFDEKLTIKKITPELEIMLEDAKNTFYFEMLSDGYKSCIFILLGLIKELEFRFPEKNAVNFEGIIMIDEIDIHLHPQWQAKLVKVLKETFPNAQIIATTHSPSILQNATLEEIIPLYKDENGDVKIKKLYIGEYGLQGWTLEEIMKDVMGMSSTTSDLYEQTIKEFDDAMYEENVPLIKEKYETLCKMLHPESTLRQLLTIQMAGLEE